METEGKETVEKKPPLMEQNYTIPNAELDRIADRLAGKLSIGIVTPRLLDIRQAAAYLGRSVSAIQHMVKRGTIPVTRIDGKIQIDRELLDRLITARTA